MGELIMIKLFVFLAISSGTHNGGNVTQIGPFKTLEECSKISEELAEFGRVRTTTCFEVIK